MSSMWRSITKLSSLLSAETSVLWHCRLLTTQRCMWSVSSLYCLYRKWWGWDGENELSLTSAKSACDDELSVQELWYELTRTECPLSVPPGAPYHFHVGIIDEEWYRTSTSLCPSHCHLSRGLPRLCCQHTSMQLVVNLVLQSWSSE